MGTKNTQKKTKNVKKIKKAKILNMLISLFMYNKQNKIMWSKTVEVTIIYQHCININDVNKLLYELKK